MQKEAVETRQSGDLRGRSVKAITHDRVANARQMNTNLMCAARAEANFEITEQSEFFQDAIFRQRGAPGSEFRRHTRSADLVTSDRGCDAPLRRFHAAMHQCQVDLFDFAIVKLQRKRLMRFVVPSDDEHPTGVFIQPVDNAGPKIS